MCGIAGFSGDFPSEVLGRMSLEIAARGPDGAGEYVDAQARVALAHRRLAILDLSEAGAQPLSDPEGRAVIVFNGEIFNFRELRRELEGRGVTFRGSSDTEVLLQLYLHDGLAMLGRLNGMFAFAIWDLRTRQLLVARDGFGVKPLYFAANRAGVAFASELKAIRHALGGRHELDPASIHRYLTFLWCPGGGTPFAAVRKLGPGEALLIEDGRISRHWQWFELPCLRAGPAMVEPERVVEGTRRALDVAVERQLVSDVPVGAFLSGGLDSSALVSSARRSTRLPCFTIDIEGGQDAGAGEDLPYAERVARHIGVDLNVIRVPSSALATDLVAMIYALDEPLADAAALNVFYICRSARQLGIKVLLSGAGGDDVFSGYRRHRAVHSAKLLDRIPAPVRRLAATASNRLDQRNPLARRVTKALAGVALDGDERLTRWFEWAPPHEVKGLYSVDFARSVGNTEANAPMRGFLPAYSKLDQLDRMLALEQRFFLADHNLLYTDKMSMAAGVEVRVPFLDPDLAELAARIPAQLKVRRGVTKWPLKAAMATRLPHDVIHRPKTGFGVPLRRWLRRDLRSWVDELLSPRVIRDRGIFDSAAVERLLWRDRDGEVDATYTIFALMCIELWCRSFVDGKTP